uniref:Uncharacterized protein n=1 Tax=Timema genevievae TaxID=629358 RepID=A0A7R9PKV9_TIMGE|nr:unnamed protein product [Timema genevievae]
MGVAGISSATLHPSTRRTVESTAGAGTPRAPQETQTAPGACNWFLPGCLSPPSPAGYQWRPRTTHYKALRVEENSRLQQSPTLEGIWCLDNQFTRRDCKMIVIKEEKIQDIGTQKFNRKFPRSLRPLYGLSASHWRLGQLETCKHEAKKENIKLVKLLPLKHFWGEHCKGPNWRLSTWRECVRDTTAGGGSETCEGEAGGSRHAEGGEKVTAGSPRPSWAQG